MIDFCILGSGVSGSTIANLLKKNYSIEIFDKANGIGGRSSNKKLSKSISFDHGLQYYSTRNKHFKKYLDKLINKKVLKYWLGNHLDFTFSRGLNSQKIIGVKSNNDFNKYLLKDVKKNFNKEILNIKFKKTHWELYGKNFKLEAKNVIITFPFEQAKKLANKYLNQKFMSLKVKMIPNITLLLKQKIGKNLPISSMRLNNKIISWVANENSKYRFFSKDNYWTVQTTDNYSKKIIDVYKKRRKYYSNQILREFSKILNLNFDSFKVYKIHGWKYSFNRKHSGLKCYWDKKLKIGLCGDWFLGPKAESAWLSANNLFAKIKKNPPKKFRRV